MEVKELGSKYTAAIKAAIKVVWENKKVLVFFISLIVLFAVVFKLQQNRIHNKKDVIEQQSEHIHALQDSITIINQ